MKAIVFHRHGGPEVLKYADAPEPALRANDVLVRVKACALNHLDLWVRRGLPNVPIPLPHIPGSDVAGEIARIGADVTAISSSEDFQLVEAQVVPSGGIYTSEETCLRTRVTDRRLTTGRMHLGHQRIAVTVEGQTVHL